MKAVCASESALIERESSEDEPFVSHVRRRPQDFFHSKVHVERVELGWKRG